MKLVGNYRFQKAANSSLVLNYLLREGDSTRSVIARDVGLTASTVTYIVQRLIDAELVVERGATEDHNESAESAGRGRRGVNVGLNADFGRVIGCDLQADYYAAVVTDVAGRVVARFRREYAARSGDFEELMVRVLTEIAEEVGDTAPIIGAGVAIPGIVGVDDAFIEECWTHRISGRDLGPFLDTAFPYTVFLENDANACAWKTLWYDSEHSPDAFLYLLPRFHRRELLTSEVPSVGIGMGLVYNGEVYHGVSNRAGEFMSSAGRPTDGTPGQLRMNGAELDRVREDRGVLRDLVAEVLGTLAPFIYMTDPRSLYIGGDLAGEQELVDEVLNNDLRWFRDAFERNGGSVVVLADAAYDPAQGAAAQMLCTLYSVPRLGGRHSGRFGTNLVTIGDGRLKSE